MFNYQFLVEEITKMVEKKIMAAIVLPRIKLETAEPKSAEAQAYDILESMRSEIIGSEDPLFVAREEAKKSIAAWVDSIDKTWGDQSEEP